MKNLENCRVIYLSSEIDKQEKVTIVHTYFNYKSDLLTKDKNNIVNEKLKKVLEREYTKLLGNNWRNVIEKYKIPEYLCYIISEPSPYRKTAWRELEDVNLALPDDFPMISTIDQTNHFWNPLDRLYEERNELLSLLFDILNVKYEVYKEFLEKKIILDTKLGFWDYSRYGFLIGIYTFESLRDKFPEIFDVYIRSQLKEYDQVKIIEVEDEVKYLRNKLC